MKKISCTLFFLTIAFFSLAQTLQISTGSASVTEAINAVKYDPSDGGTVQVGHITNAGTGQDCFIAKYNSFHQLVWQKYISNNGTDDLFQVIVCANGEYVATGIFVVSGTMRGFICRVNNTNGNIIWANTSDGTNSPNGDKFYDVYETANKNLAVAGVTNFASGQTNGLAVLFDTNGALIWSRVSNYFSADEFYTVNQLPNNDLIFAGFYNVGSNYNAVILEINENTAAISSQKVYSISTTIPGVPLTLNSLWASRCYVKNGTVVFLYSLFEGFGSNGYGVVYNYDLLTKNLVGNIYYHTGLTSGANYSFYPIGANDILYANSYNTTSTTVISRVTNGIVAFDRKINSPAVSIVCMDSYNGNFISGGYVNNNPDLDVYNLASVVSFPVSATPCTVADYNKLVLQPANLVAVSSSPIVLSAISPITNITNAVTSTN